MHLEIRENSVDGRDKGMIPFIAFLLCSCHCVAYIIKISSFVSFNSLKACRGI